MKQMIWQTRSIFTSLIKHVQKTITLHHVINAPAQTLYKTQNTKASVQRCSIKNIFLKWHSRADVLQ